MQLFHPQTTEATDTLNDPIKQLACMANWGNRQNKPSRLLSPLRRGQRLRIFRQADPAPDGAFRRHLDTISTITAVPPPLGPAGFPTYRSMVFSPAVNAIDPLCRSGNRKIGLKHPEKETAGRRAGCDRLAIPIMDLRIQILFRRFYFAAKISRENNKTTAEQISIKVPSAERTCTYHGDLGLGGSS